MNSELRKGKCFKTLFADPISDLKAMSWAGVRKRLCDGKDWMVIGRHREELEEDEEGEDENIGEEEDEDEPFSLFDPNLCHSHPDAAYLDKTLGRVSR